MSDDWIRIQMNESYRKRRKTDDDRADDMRLPCIYHTNLSSTIYYYYYFMKDPNCGARTRLCCIQSVHSGKSIESQRDESSGERRHSEKKTHTATTTATVTTTNDIQMYADQRKKLKIKPHLLKAFQKNIIIKSTDEWHSRKYAAQNSFDRHTLWFKVVELDWNLWNLKWKQ